MAGSYYVALSGMRTRLDALDRLASDIANVGTAGYKAERGTTSEAQRPTFGESLQSAIDVATGGTRVDLRAGSIAPTGRDIDAAIDGPGFFAVSTPAGERYTRDGRFARRADGVLTTNTGEPLVNAQPPYGPITIPEGPIQIDADGIVRSGTTQVGRLKVVEFDASVAIARDNAHLFAPGGATPKAATQSVVRAGAVEQSNVSVVDRIAELTTVSRGFETLQRALTVLSNDIDGRAISELGRR